MYKRSLIIYGVGHYGRKEPASSSYAYGLMATMTRMTAAVATLATVVQ